MLGSFWWPAARSMAKFKSAPGREAVTGVVLTFVEKFGSAPGAPITLQNLFERWGWCTQAYLQNHMIKNDQRSLRCSTWRPLVILIPLLVKYFDRQKSFVAPACCSNPTQRSGTSGQLRYFRATYRWRYKGIFLKPGDWQLLGTFMLLATGRDARCVPEKLWPSKHSKRVSASWIRNLFVTNSMFSENQSIGLRKFLEPCGPLYGHALRTVLCKMANNALSVPKSVRFTVPVSVLGWRMGMGYTTLGATMFAKPFVLFGICGHGQVEWKPSPWWWHWV